MIWKTKTHKFSATLCQRTGQPCPALARMARAIAHSMETARPVTQDCFEVEGSSELNHCAEGCMARFRANPDQIRVFCGTDTGADVEVLDRYADMLFGIDTTALPASGLTTPPCAMIEVLSLDPTPVRTEAAQACA